MHYIHHLFNKIANNTAPNMCNKKCWLQSKQKAYVLCIVIQACLQNSFQKVVQETNWKKKKISWKKTKQNNPALANGWLQIIKLTFNSHLWFAFCLLHAFSVHWHYHFVNHGLHLNHSKICLFLILLWS